MTNFILNLDGFQLYFWIVAALLGGAMGLPIPEDFPLIYAGAVLGQGKGSVVLMGLVCYCSILCGDFFIFMVGRWGGTKLLSSTYVQTRLKPEKVENVALHLEKHSLLTIFFARHLFYMRSITFLTCGAVGMSMTRFLVADALAALISTPLMLFLGYIASDSLKYVFEQVQLAKDWTVGAGLTLAALYLLYRILRNRQHTP